MVLEEATSSSEPQPSFNEALPTSSPDLYSGDRNPQVLETRNSSYITISPGVHVNTQNLPRPWMGATPRGLNTAIFEACQQASIIMNRPVRQEEADALAFHFARAVRIGSYGTPIGSAVGAALWYRGFKNGSYRFPGYTPNKERFNPNKFGRLQGRNAKYMWHSLRFGAYGIVGVMMGSVLIGSYALTAGSAGRLMDPRLKELKEKIIANSKQGKNGELLPGQMAGGGEVDQTGGQRQGETYDMARQRRGVQRAGRESGAWQTQNIMDDASPTGAMFMSDYQENESPSDSGVMSDGHVKQRDSQVRFEEARRDAQQSRNDGFGAAPKSSGSAWERLRQQASSGEPGQSSTKSRRDASSPVDSFMSLQGEDNRRQEQKAFDQKMEREREGKDFESQSGGWRR
ncbi:hypothetical protein CLAFUW4_12354 [Fulvia fulva]|nr:hypothetical protein CLAFUR4_12359 [Fulvia fulva]WPV17867.1 hypothetical protein CLAFUW4_12354 [Fulvia fulva]WPV33591.1 hypothetical protein CLAFUW7_12361 [Fulvia fulva]